ncbi:TrkH family potassium uptake protein [Pararhizobium sp. PWRC1-1]|uniref:TrkH family potassium uptake protein n=1 Tax=Pararhizobium sp. PWRC1-1 TaxID=2804566 RepID=UPI003CFB0636
MISTLSTPTRIIPAGFLIAIAVGTGLLMLPFASESPGGADFVTALFTATSAVSVTGLTVVDTSSFWSNFGRAVIITLIQVGGFGIMAGATLLGLLVNRRLGLSTRLIAQAETRTLAVGEIASVLKLTLIVTLTVEAAIMLVLTLRFHYTYGEAWPDALWNGLFKAVSSFNNAGFSTYSGSLVPFALDWLVLIPIAFGVIIGGIGFPVLADIRRNPLTPARWAVHTKITLLGTAILFATGAVATLAFEWNNAATLGAFPPMERMMNAAFHSVMTRSGGFNAVDTGAMQIETLTVSFALMLVGGGSAGTAGGIKVSTFFILGLVVWAEVRGEPDTVAFRRRISPEVQRQALTVALLAVALVGLGTLSLLAVSHLPLEKVLFEVISAFATVGLSTGITASLPPSGHIILVVLMFIGRVGSITIATSLALRSMRRPYRYPQERPIVG